MNFLEEVKTLGFDVENAMERFMGNSELLEKMIKMLPSSIYPSKFGGKQENDMEVLSYIESGNIETAIEKAHSLKSIMGNLSINKLYLPYSKILDFLRSGEISMALELTKKIIPVQENIIFKIMELSK